MRGELVCCAYHVDPARPDCRDCREVTARVAAQEAYINAVAGAAMIGFRALMNAKRTATVES